MGTDNIGQLIRTATKNIYYERELTDEERSLANQLAPYIHQSERNWLPVYVREIGRHQYKLVGSPVVLEANKLAEQKVTYCIQVGTDEGIEVQIERGQYLPESNGRSNGDNHANLLPLMKRMEALEKQLASQNEKIEEILKQVVPAHSGNELYSESPAVETHAGLALQPPQTPNHISPEREPLHLNSDDERSLEDKLGRIPGIGEKTLPKAVREIIDQRPFRDESEFKAKVSLFKPPKKRSKASKPKSQQLWEALNKNYRPIYEAQ